MTSDVMDASLQRDVFRPRRPGGLGKGALLAVLVHLLLILALAVGVSWKVRQPEGVEAELWSAVPQIAAPPAAHPAPPTPPTPPAPSPPAPPAPPPPPPAPAPQVKPVPAAKAEPPPAPPIDAQIAIEQAKREEAKRQQAAEQAAALKREQAQQDAAKQEAARQQAVKQEAARQEAQRQAQLEKAQLEKAQREKAAAEKAAAEEAKRQEAARQAKAEQERKKQQEEQARVAAATAAQREAYLQRMQSQAGAANSTGTAARNSGPSATYAGRIKARIKPNIVFSDSISGNPLATVEVRVAPDGAIVSRRLVHSSGVRAWDDAVLRAIDKTETLPRDIDGSVPPRLQIEFKPND